MQRLSVIQLLIGFETAIWAAILPLVHRGPFDRIIIAEALKENLSFLTKVRTLNLIGVYYDHPSDGALT